MRRAVLPMDMEIMVMGLGLMTIVGRDSRTDAMGETAGMRTNPNIRETVRGTALGRDRETAGQAAPIMAAGRAGMARDMADRLMGQIRAADTGEGAPVKFFC